MGGLGLGSGNAATVHAFSAALRRPGAMPQLRAMHMAHALTREEVGAERVLGDRIHTHRGRSRYSVGVTSHLDSGLPSII
jgi:hypothetical protein